jgi:hypothetical protein
MNETMTTKSLSRSSEEPQDGPGSTERTVPTLDETIEAAFTADEYSPYALIMIVNDLLSDLGSDKVLNTQMGYNYVNNGLIKGVSTREVGVKNSKKDGVTTRTAKFVSREGAVAWAKKYVSKNVTV